MTDKVVLFCDVDGVWAPWDHTNRYIHGSGLSDFWKWQSYEIGVGRGQKWLSLSKDMGAAVAALDVDFRWLTTWTESASLIASIVGLPTDAEIASRPYPFGNRPWKWFAVRDFMEEHPGHPFIWIDDDAISDFEIEKIEASDSPALVIQPFSHVGLTPMDIHAMSKFVEGNQQ